MLHGGCQAILVMLDCGEEFRRSGFFSLLLFSPTILLARQILNCGAIRELAGHEGGEGKEERVSDSSPKKKNAKEKMKRFRTWRKLVGTSDLHTHPRHFFLVACQKFFLFRSDASSI